MKIAVIGAAGVRTPLILQSMVLRQERLGLDELSLMDIDAHRLDLIGALTQPLERSGKLRFRLTRTTDAATALDAADFVITTYRVGGIESRVIDERVPLQYGVLGQETTGPGGFAMGMRSIPVLLDYLEIMRRVCPNAWLVNFSNPAGMVAEAACTAGGWQRVVGICDAPQGMQRAAAALAGVPAEAVFLDYFGLNHLGWVRSVYCQGSDLLPGFLDAAQQAGRLPGLPFQPGLLATLGMVPNEYLYYYYHAQQAVDNILRAEQTRGEMLADLNRALFADLDQLSDEGNLEAMTDRYQAYLDRRGETYMATETGMSHAREPQLAELAGEGYAGVALDLVEGLAGIRPAEMVLNLPNQGAISGMAPEAVVEIPAFVGKDIVRPLAVGQIPAHCLGLMLQVKAYEQLTIQAAVEHSYEKALLALTIHPLVRDRALAGSILDGYIAQHGENFPRLQ